MSLLWTITPRPCFRRWPSLGEWWRVGPYPFVQPGVKVASPSLVDVTSSPMGCHASLVQSVERPLEREPGTAPSPEGGLHPVPSQLLASEFLCPMFAVHWSALACAPVTCAS